LIRRLLVITPKRVFFSTSRADFEDSPKVKIVDLKLPVEVFQDIEKKLQHIDYLTTTDILQNDLTEHYREVFTETSCFSTLEKDRIWLFEQSKK
jgi:hypothetical protein